MSGINFLADTNAIIYLLAGNSCMAPYKDAVLGVSVITEMELLSFPHITNHEINILGKLFEKCIIFPLDDKIKQQSIFFRRNYGLKLPDAIIAATAKVYEVSLLIADKDFEKIEDLNLRLLNP